MPPTSHSVRARPYAWALAVACGTVLSGCPQLASDDFTKASDLPATNETGDIDTGGSQGSGGTTPHIDLTSSTVSAGGNTASSNTGTGGSQVDPNTSAVTTTTDTTTSGSSVTTSSGGSGASGGSGGSGATGGIAGTSSDIGGTGGTTTTGEPLPCEPADEVCDGLDNDCDDVVDQGNVCPDLCEGFAIEGHGYMFCGDTTIVSRARTLCANQDMTLVQIDSAEENQAVVAAVQEIFEDLAEPNGKQAGFWTSGSDSEYEGDWVWTSSDMAFWSGDENGEPTDGAYVNWGEGKPNNAVSTWQSEDCLVIYIESGEDGATASWNDLPCADPYSYVCESD